MSSFAEILRRQEQGNQPRQRESTDTHHHHRHQKGHTRRDEDDDDEGTMTDDAPPEQQSNHSAHHSRTSSWATRLQQSSGNAAASTTASTKTARTPVPPSTVATSMVQDTTDEGYSPEESAAIAAENAKALQYLLSYLPYYPIMLVLCGIPGSGKSTFARRLLAAIPVDYQPYWISLNQDALGDRKTVMAHTEYALNHHQNTIIDRCNFNAEQRSPWIHLAYKFHIPAVVAFILPDHNNVTVCAERAYKRGNSDGVHPGHPDWNTVCARMNGDYSDPSLDEGFSGIYKCRDAEDITAFIEAIVQAYNVYPRPHENETATGQTDSAPLQQQLEQQQQQRQQQQSAPEAVSEPFVNTTASPPSETH